MTKSKQNIILVIAKVVPSQVVEGVSSLIITQKFKQMTKQE